MRNLSATLFFIVFLLGYFGSAGQEQFITLTGKVTNRQTKEPVPYANIHIKSGSIGTASNSSGEFVFKIPVRLSGDTVLVSSVGYKTAAVVPGPGEFIEVPLDPAPVVLQEVTISAESGLTLFKEILARIPRNYDTAGVRLTAFYSENYWLGDFELAFNEAVLDIYKVFNYDKKHNDQIRLIKGRKKNVNFGNDGQFLFWISNISNTARSTLLEDLVKYNQAKFTPFNPKNFRFYEYDYRETIREEGGNILLIDIYPKEKARRAYVKIKMYVDEASLAIIRLDIEVTPEGIAYINKHEKGFGYAIMSKVVKARLDFSAFKVSLSYKKYRDKWYLNSIQRHWEAKVNSKKRNMVDRLWRVDMNFVVTDIKTDSVKPFTEGDIGKNRSSMASIIGSNYDPSFWENYNVVKTVGRDSLYVDVLDVDSVSRYPLSVDSLRGDSLGAGRAVEVSNRENGFTRADTLRGKLSEVRSCYDVSFYHLDVAVDMEKRSISGSNLIRFKATTSISKMQVDLYANMKIESIMLKDKSLPYTREFDAVFIQFPEELAPGDESEITIRYEGVPKVPDWSIPMNGGVLWDKDSLGNLWAQMVCQGSGASLWWPNKDHLSDEPDSMKIWITVPSEFTEISNGRLIRKTPAVNNQTRYEWFVSYPINNYNVTFNIGKYVHFSDHHITDDTLTIDYYVMPYNLERAKQLFEQVKPMLSCFEEHFGKYPFARDGFTLVESLYPMEHQSGVCIGRIPQENAGNPNPLMWHESAHEWWGNAISVKDMADLWIHEAFATYAESLMIECEHGKEAALQFIKDHRSAVRNFEPIIGVYDVNHIFYEIGDMYEKGMLMLNTFRHVLNDDTRWFAVLRNIQRHFRYQTLTTEELIRFINRETQSDYTYFFDQYLKHTSLPVLEVELTERGDALTVKYRWRADVAEFRMPVLVTTGVDSFDFIYPEQEWKDVTFNNMAAGDFEVDEERFFIEVEEF